MSLASGSDRLNPFRPSLVSVVPVEPDPMIVPLWRTQKPRKLPTPQGPRGPRDAPALAIDWTPPEVEMVPLVDCGDEINLDILGLDKIEDDLTITECWGLDESDDEDDRPAKKKHKANGTGASSSSSSAVPVPKAPPAPPVHTGLPWDYWPVGDIGRITYDRKSDSLNAHCRGQGHGSTCRFNRAVSKDPMGALLRWLETKCDDKAAHALHKLTDSPTMSFENRDSSRKRWRTDAGVAGAYEIERNPTGAEPREYRYP